MNDHPTNDGARSPTALGRWLARAGGWLGWAARWLVLGLVSYRGAGCLGFSLYGWRSGYGAQVAQLLASCCGRLWVFLASFQCRAQKKNAFGSFCAHEALTAGSYHPTRPRTTHKPRQPYKHPCTTHKPRHPCPYPPAI